MNGPEFEPTDDEPSAPPPRCGSSFPLFFALIPQIAAFAFCGNVPWSAEISEARWLALGTLFLLISAGASFCENFFSGPGVARAAALVRIGVPAGAFFFFCAWWNFCAPPVADWSGKSPRDVEAVLRVEKSYSSSVRNFSGIARVERISGEAVEPVAGTRVWYSVAKTLCSESGLGDAPAEGARLRVSGVLSGISEDDFSAPGFFGFLRRERVSAFVTRIDGIAPAAPGERSFAERCAAAKKFLERRLEKISGDGEGGVGGFSRSGRLLGAMLLGERSLLLPDQKDNFLLTGTLHLFAVSGLHISALSAGLLWLFRICRAPRVPAWIAMLAGLWLFVQIIGAPPSAMRAWLMSVFVFAGCLFGRGNAAFRGLAAAAFVALTLDPLVLNNAGFRLSYLVVAAILLYGVPAAERLSRLADVSRWIPDSALSRPRRIAARAVRGVVFGFCVSASAFLAGTPIVIAAFGFCSVLSLAANVVLVPVAVAAVWLGAGALAAACVPMVGGFFGSALFALSAIPLWFLDRLSGVLACVPADLELRFYREEIGTSGGLLLLILFFLGERLRYFRECPGVRFLLPAGVLVVFLALFAY